MVSVEGRPILAGLAIMFAPFIVKPQMKNAVGSSDQLALRRATALGHDRDVEQAPTNRFAWQAGERFTDKEPSGVAWDFSRIPLYPQGRKSWPERRSPAPMPRFPGPIQRTFKVGAVDDPLEHEADRVADQMMRMPAPEVAATSASPQISRNRDGCDQEEKLRKKEAGLRTGVGEAPASVYETLRSPGQPLDAPTRGFFEPRFQHDFSDVRVHTGPHAEQSARQINARAYTIGQDMVFDAGQFAPATPQGRSLIAHELTHVVQQSKSQGGSSAGIGASETIVRRAPPQPDAKAPTQPNNEIQSYVYGGDKRDAANKEVARSWGQKMAAQIQKHGGKANHDDRVELQGMLDFFKGEAREIYIEQIQLALPDPKEIQMPEEPVRPQSYVYGGDKRQATDIYVAQRMGRQIAYRIRQNGGKISPDDRLEIQGMETFFQGEARGMYAKQISDYRKPVDRQLVVLINQTVEELDRDSPSDKVLVSNMLNGFKLSSKQWALELFANYNRQSGNYLLRFFEEIDHGAFRDAVPTFKKVLEKDGIMVDEMFLDRELQRLAVEEMDEHLRTHLKNYPIYDWKVAVGGLLKPFVQVAEFVIHFIPYVGEAVGAIEALSGRELLTGEKLSGWDRFLSILPYSGKILRGGAAGAKTIFIIARETKLNPRAILRLLKTTSSLASEADELRAIKKLVDMHGAPSAAQQQLLMATRRPLAALEKELEAAGAAEVKSARAAETAPVVPAPAPHPADSTLAPHADVVGPPAPAATADPRFKGSPRARNDNVPHGAGVTVPASDPRLPKLPKNDPHPVAQVAQRPLAATGTGDVAPAQTVADHPHVPPAGRDAPRMGPRPDPGAPAQGVVAPIRPAAPEPRTAPAGPHPTRPADPGAAHAPVAEDTASAVKPVAPARAADLNQRLAANQKRIAEIDRASAEHFEKSRDYARKADDLARQDGQGFPERSRTAARQANNESILARKDEVERSRLQGENDRIANELNPPKAPKAGPPPGRPHGGAYRDMEAWGGERHHVPPDSVTGLSYEEGPAIWMETADHQALNSSGNRRFSPIQKDGRWISSGSDWRDLQEELIRKGNVDEAIDMEVEDIRLKFGDKYEDGIKQMLEYRKKLSAGKFIKPR